MSNPNVLLDREKYIGGSDLPTILGLNCKYGTSIFDFAKEKIGLQVKNFTGNQFTKYGQMMEPLIRDYINSKYNANYKEDTKIEGFYRGNTDGIDTLATIPLIEIKTFGDELDVDYYNAQCQFYMQIFNVDCCLLVGYKRPDNFYRGVDYELENDDNYFNFEFDENNIIEYEIKRDTNFWNKIEKRIISFKNALEKLKENPNITEEEFNNIFFGTDLIEMSNKLTILENKLVTYETLIKEQKTLKEKLYKLFDEKGIISFDTGTIKITKVSPTSYETETINVTDLKENEPNIYEKYKVIKTSNRKGYILITKKKGEK